MKFVIAAATLCLALCLASADDEKKPCPGAVCDGDPGGCCTQPGYVCCPDSLYCAKDLKSCPPDNKEDSSKAAKLTNQGPLVKLSSDKCDGTLCSAGCCEEKGWFCCADGDYCAKTKDDCPNF